MADRVVEDPVLGQRYAFARRTDPDGGEVLEVEMWVDPGGGVTPHLHPAMEERFEVLGGRPEFLAGRKWAAADPGETVVVPPNTRHAFRNRGDEVAHVRAEVRPPSTLQEFLEDVAGLSRAGRLTKRGFPRGPTAALQSAELAHAYRDMATLMFPPAPPKLVQRLLFPPLARLAKRRGHRAGTFKDLA